MIPATHRNLAGTLGEQLAHLQMHIAGGASFAFAPPQAVSKVDLDADPELAEMPPGVTPSQWKAYNTTSTARVLEVLRRAERPLSTQQVTDAAGRSRPTVHRILCVCLVLGDVTRERRLTGKHRGDAWELVR